VSVPTRLSVSIEIIINELVTNAAKYAFADVDDPAVRIVCGVNGRDTIRVVVEDNGRVYPVEQLAGEGYGFGLTLVSSLAAQHEGTLTLENAGGARAEAIMREPAGS